MYVRHVKAASQPDFCRGQSTRKALSAVSNMSHSDKERWQLYLYLSTSLGGICVSYYASLSLLFLSFVWEDFTGSEHRVSMTLVDWFLSSSFLHILWTVYHVIYPDIFHRASSSQFKVLDLSYLLWSEACWVSIPRTASRSVLHRKSSEKAATPVSSSLGSSKIETACTALWKRNSNSWPLLCLASWLLDLKVCMHSIWPDTWGAMLHS